MDLLIMCNSGTCPHEISSGRNWGDCGKKSWQKCPDDMTEEEMQDNVKDLMDQFVNFREFGELSLGSKWKTLTEEQQKKIVKDFNDILDKYRDKYASMFLSNYIDAKFNIKKSAFKFVMMVVKK